jgi:hemoglobin/transferrin/lactoferrin receptor protein
MIRAKISLLTAICMVVLLPFVNGQNSTQAGQESSQSQNLPDNAKSGQESSQNQNLADNAKSGQESSQSQNLPDGSKSGVESSQNQNLPDTVALGEVVVSIWRIDRKIKELPASVSIVTSATYQKRSSITLSNVLNNQPGISMGGDGVWATNINIRGLGESRLVTLIDGNRIETATDLTASLSMIDVNDVERVEVIKGAQSSLYGTGAMGGIVNIITKGGYFADKPYLSGSVITGYASANNLFSGYTSVNTGSQKWYLSLSGSYTDADNMRTPNGVLPNSQFTTNNFRTTIGVKPFNNHLIKLQYQRNRSSNVGIPGGDAFPLTAQATYRNISRDLFAASYEISNISEILTSLKFSYFNQYIDRDVTINPNTINEATLPNGNTQRTTPTLMTPTGEHLTNGVQLQGTLKLWENNSTIVGADLWGRKLTTGRERFITVQVINPAGTTLVTNNIERGETPIPQSRSNNAGLFIQNETKMLNGDLTLIVGGRMDGVQITNQKGYDVDYMIVNGVRNDAPSTRRVTFNSGREQSLSWSANTGLLYKLNSTTDLALNVARSFRAPSLEERFKYIDLGSYVRLGNPALMPERGYSADMGVRVWKKDLTLQAGIFINSITDMIAETPGEFIYTLASGSEPQTLPAFINSNISKALLYGFDFQMDYNLYRNWVVMFTGGYVRGKDVGEDSSTGTGVGGVAGSSGNLPMIPPLKGGLGVRYSSYKLGSAELLLTGAAKQNKIAAGERETAGYLRLDLSFNTRKIDLGPTRIQLFAGIDNITNTRYTNHLSTNRGDINTEPGRNIYLRLKLDL